MTTRNRTRRALRLAAILSPALALAGLFPAPRAHAHDGPELAEPPPEALCVTALVKTGGGANAYESVPNWCQLPEGKKDLGATHGGVVVDKAGNIYFSLDSDRMGGKGILVYSPDGKLQKAIADGLVGIHGMCLNTEGDEQFIYAAHLKGKQAVKLKLDGSVVWAIDADTVLKDSGKYKAKGEYNPTAVAVGPTGDVYIADGYGLSYIHQYDKNQKYVRTFGGRGGEPGQFQTCHGIALDTRGDKPVLLVCDRENHRIQHLDLDGKPLGIVWKDERTDANGHPINRARPCCVSFRGKDVAVADLAGEVLILDADNKLVATLGDNPDAKERANFNVPPDDWKPGIFNAPHGISYDADGNLYVMDWNATGRVSKMKKAPEEKAKSEQARAN